MVFYYCIIILLCSAAGISLDKRCSKYVLAFLLVVLFVILSIFAGTRIVGYDLDNYQSHFDVTNQLSSYVRYDWSMEIGYEIFVSFTKMISRNFHFFLWLFTSLSLWFVFKLFLRYSPYPLVSFMLFCSFSYFIMVMGQMRQPIAVALAYLLSIPILLKNRRLLCFIITFSLALLFHKSLYLFALIICFTKKNYSVKTFIWGFILSFIVLFSVSNAFNNLVISFLPKDLFLASAAEAYLSYRGKTLLFSLGMLERLGCSVLLIYFIWKNRLHRNILLRIVSNIYVLGSFLYISLLGISTEFASRGTYPFSFSLFLAFPILIKLLKGRQRAVVILTSFAISIYHFSDFLLNPGIYNPYKSFLF